MTLDSVREPKYPIGRKKKKLDMRSCSLRVISLIASHPADSYSEE
jgi:hypothetical protein